MLLVGGSNANLLSEKTFVIILDFKLNLSWPDVVQLRILEVMVNIYIYIEVEL